MAGETIIATVVIVGNLIVLLAIATVPSLRSVTNYFVASLAAADLLVGILGKVYACLFTLILCTKIVLMFWLTCAYRNATLKTCDYFFNGQQSVYVATIECP